MPSGRGHGLGQVASDHLGGETAKLGGASNESCRDSMHEGRRGRVAQSRMDIPHILGICSRFEDMASPLDLLGHVQHRFRHVVTVVAFERYDPQAG